MLIEMAADKVVVTCTYELGEFLYVRDMLKSFPPFKCTDFVRCVLEL